MPVMLRFRRGEKLLDTLLSLTEIFRLVGYIKHIPYTLLNPAHGAVGLANQFGSFPFCGSCRLLFTTSHRIPQAITQVSQPVHELPEDKMANLCVRMIQPYHLA
jgi:hypothetical protein